MNIVIIVCALFACAAASTHSEGTFLFFSTTVLLYTALCGVTTKARSAVKRCLVLNFKFFTLVRIVKLICQTENSLQHTELL